MEAVVHLTDPGSERRRRATARARQLTEPAADADTVTLVAELDASTMVIDAAESTEGVQELLHDGHRVTTNRTSLERRDIPIDAVEILECSTRS